MQCFVYHSSLAETREGSTSEQSFSTSNEKKIFNRLYHIPFLFALRLKIAPFRSVEEISERPSLHGRSCSSPAIEYNQTPRIKLLVYKVRAFNHQKSDENNLRT